jgi:hypothetical protein
MGSPRQHHSQMQQVSELVVLVDVYGYHLLFISSSFLVLALFLLSTVLPFLPHLIESTEEPVLRYHHASRLVRLMMMVLMLGATSCISA